LPGNLVAFSSLIIDALDIVIVLALDIVQIISIWIYLDTLFVVTASPVSLITRSYGECIPWLIERMEKLDNIFYSWDTAFQKLSED